jgi:hypothetical protein
MSKWSVIKGAFSGDWRLVIAIIIAAMIARFAWLAVLALAVWALLKIGVL